MGQRAKTGMWTRVVIGTRCLRLPVVARARIGVLDIDARCMR